MKHKLPQACQETRETLTLGTTDEGRSARAAFHLERCTECQQSEEIMAGFREAVLSADDSLDDLTKARVQSRLAQTMDETAAALSKSAKAPPGRGLKISAALAAGLAALAIIAGLLLWTTSSPTVREQGLPQAHPIVSQQDSHKVLQPRAILKGSKPWPNSGLVFGERVARVSVPAGVALRAGLAQRAELTLYGPLDLAVEQVSEKDILLNLSRGILVGDYENEADGTLRIRSPRADTEIIGTLFSIEAHDGQSRVSVSHGKVRVRSAGKSVVVGARQTWSTARAKVGATPPVVAALFSREEQPMEQAAEVMAPRKDTPRIVASPAIHHRPARARVAPPAPQQSRPAVAAAVSPAVPPQDNTAAEPAKRPPQGVAKPTEQPEPTKKPMTASTLYRTAEEALRQRDPRKARVFLQRILRTYPENPLADSARYELALLLLRSGKKTEAEAVLSKVGASNIDSTRFKGPAHYLRCRIQEESGAKEKAMACFRAFRDTFPSSPHDQQALQTLIHLSWSAKGCKGALGLISDYLALYPEDAFAKEARRLRGSCIP